MSPGDESEGRRVTYTELQDFGERIDAGFRRLEDAIEKSEEKWRERTHELASTSQAHAIKLALQEQRIGLIETAATAAKEDRRWLYGSVVGAAGSIGAFVAWLTEFLRHKP